MLLPYCIRNLFCSQFHVLTDSMHLYRLYLMKVKDTWKIEEQYSFSLIILIATSLIPLKRISRNLVVMKDILCRCKFSYKKIRLIFSLEFMVLLNLEIWSKWKNYSNILSSQLLWNSNQISWNLVVMQTNCEDLHIPRNFWFSYLF